MNIFLIELVYLAPPKDALYVKLSSHFQTDICNHSALSAYMVSIRRIFYTN